MRDVYVADGFAKVYPGGRDVGVQREAVNVARVDPAGRDSSATPDPTVAVFQS